MRLFVTPRRGKGVIACQDTGRAEMATQVKKKILANTFWVLRVFFFQEHRVIPSKHPKREKGS